jgi:hypothetical protein
VESRERRAESREQRAESREQRAESGEHRIKTAKQHIIYNNVRINRKATVKGCFFIWGKNRKLLGSA